jgi:2-polyprenyl-6-hydroxyphenyl methylase/3-demethylubiquinone-9 3-methyltransferase
MIDNETLAPIKSATDATIDVGEIEKFSAIAEEWWDPDGKFRPLHKLNPARLGFLRDRIADHFNRNPVAPAPLRDLKILDIGCGGGLITEPLRRLGARVTGVDASEKNIAVAKHHAEKMGLEIDYRFATSSTLVEERRQFDAVVNMEVIEHVADTQQFIRECAGLIKPGGLMILATLNRTPKSFALAIVGAEYVLRWLPRGTHDWRKFVKPSELAAICRPAGLDIVELSGLRYDPLKDRWQLAPGDLAVNYMAVAEKSAT